MTTQEAIRILTLECDDWETSHCNPLVRREAFDMAIECLQTFGNGSEIPNGSRTKFKPGSKFLLEIGEKRIGLDEYSIVGTDLYVWGSLLEKLTPYESDGDTISRQAALSKIDLVPYLKEHPNTALLLKEWINSLPSVQVEQKWIPVKKELPKDRSWNLGIFRESDTGWVNPIPFVCDYVGRETPITTKDFWIIKEHDGAIDYYRNLECIAWQPLPEFYRGDTE